MKFIVKSQKWLRVLLCHTQVDVLYSKVRDIARQEHFSRRPGILKSFYKLLNSIISVVKNGDANLRGTKMTPRAPQRLTFFPRLKTDSAKRFVSTSHSYEANFIPIHPLGMEKTFKTCFLDID